MKKNYRALSENGIHLDLITIKNKNKVNMLLVVLPEV